MSWQLFDRLRAFIRRGNVYQSEQIFQDQSDFARVVSGQEFIDFSQQHALLQQTALQINRLERYKDFDQMDEVGTITLALDTYADEGSLIEPETGHAVIIKAKSKKVKQELEDLFFETLLIDRHIRPMMRYLCKYGDFVTEIIPTKNRDAVQSIKFMNVYNFTRVETKYGDLVGFFYQDQFSKTPTLLHPWQVMHLRLTTYENIFHPYGRCCTLCSRVWTPDGSKQLRDVEPGDEIYTFDGEKAVITKAIKTVKSGVKSTIVIKTKHRSIQVTPEHPLLAIVKNNYFDTKFGPKRDIKTKQYVLARDLEIGDKLILPRLDDASIGKIPIEKYKISGHAGKKLNIPDHIDEDFAWLMGFVIGDGWIPSSNDGQLCIAEGEHQEHNSRFIDIIRSYGCETFRHVKIRRYGYFKFNSVELSRTIANMGLYGRSYEKRIPEWVFTAPRQLKTSFINGLVDSDGSTNVDKWGCTRYQLELTSEQLVRDFKVLLDQMNIKCGNVGKRNRPVKFTIIHGKKYPRRDSWLVYWFDSQLPCGDLMHYGKRRTKYDNSTDRYLVETILSIDDGQEEEVGDIQVESKYHNFIADGVVIHNSILDGARKDFKRLRLMEDAALIYRITRAPEKRIFSIPVGNITPKEVPQYMELIARQFKKRKFVDPATGNVNERWSPLMQEDDFFLPKRPDGQGPSIDTLPGAENLDKIADIEYFKKAMVSALKIPFSRVGIGEATESDGKSLSSVAPEFAKAVQWMQREIVIGLKKVAIVHLALKGYSIEDIKGFDLRMTASSAIDELYRIETWNSRADIIRRLKDTQVFDPEWILTTFTTLTPDEVSEMQDKIAASLVPEPGMAGLPGMPPPPGGAPPGVIPGAIGPPIPGESKDPEFDNLIAEFGKFKERSLETDRILTEDKNITNGFDFIIDQNELDGLPTPDNGQVSDDLLVEWGVENETRQEVIEEVKKLIQENGIIITEVSEDGQRQMIHTMISKSDEDIISETIE